MGNEQNDIDAAIQQDHDFVLVDKIATPLVD
jgi:hypothetical protein